MNKPLLVVGADGLLGGALRARWQREKHQVLATTLNPASVGMEVQRLDLAQPPETWPVLAPCRVAVLCAAITSLDQCRRDPAGTRKVNVDHTLALAGRLAEQGAFVVFLSTNLVFDGTKPLRRADEPLSPQTEYGRQKAAVETGLQSLGRRHAVVRLTKVFHPGLALVRDWLDALRAGRPIVPFADMVCAPVALETVLHGLARVAADELAGGWQFSPNRDISFADIAMELARLTGADLALVRPGSARQLATFEHLPAYTTLDSRQTCDQLGLNMPDPNVLISEMFP